MYDDQVTEHCYGPCTTSGMLKRRGPLVSRTDPRAEHVRRRCTLSGAGQPKKSSRHSLWDAWAMLSPKTTGGAVVRAHEVGRPVLLNFDKEKSQDGHPPFGLL